MSEFIPSRRSVVRTAAWSLPVVTIATAAPAFAASPPEPDPTLPNLSGSVSNTTKPLREENKVTISPTTFMNSGGSIANGLLATFTSDVPVSLVQLGAYGLEFAVPNLGVTFTDAPDVTATTPRTVFTLDIPAAAPANAIVDPADADGYTSAATQILTFPAGNTSATITVTVVAKEGGTPYIATFTA